LTEVSPLDVEGLLTALEKAEIRFVVIGGFAVGAHGYPRATKDLDIVPDPAPENLRRLASLLAELDASILGMEEFADEEVVQLDAAGLEMGGNFVLLTRHGRLDIMQLVGPELVAMKEAAGRPEDLIDLRRLRESRDGA
jgi:hypothetical protein